MDIDINGVLPLNAWGGDGAGRAAAAATSIPPPCAERHLGDGAGKELGRPLPDNVVVVVALQEVLILPMGIDVERARVWREERVDKLRVRLFSYLCGQLID